jgi:hypothetical protein
MQVEREKPAALSGNECSELSFLSSLLATFGTLFGMMEPGFSSI